MVELEDVNFSYGGEKDVLSGVTLTLSPGERVLVLGANGSGKSTLARLLNGSLRPDAGRVLVDGSTVGLRQRVGYVRQDPRNQIVSAVVSDEVAFGPRNLGLSREEIHQRVDEALAACGICDLRDRMTAELSGGQQQLVALAGVLAMRPRYLVLDEVRSMLDQATRSRVGRIIQHLVEEGMGVIEITHDVEALLGANRVLVLAGGRLAWDGTPQELLCSDEASELAGITSTATNTLAGVLRRAAAAGTDLREEPCAEMLAPYAQGVLRQADAHEASRAQGSTDIKATLTVQGVSFSYGEARALANISLEARGLTLILGPSGGGKSTLARVLTGVLNPDEGEVLLDGVPVRAGMVGLAFQRPEDQLFCETVRDELAYGPRVQGSSEEEIGEKITRAARLLGIDGQLMERSPFELSGGQMRRVALAGVVAPEPRAYVFDEPTAGLDHEGRCEFHDLIGTLVEEGACVVVVTHDVEEWLDEADQVVLLREGVIVACPNLQELASNPALFSAAGLEAPLMVRLRAAVKEVTRDA